MRRRVAVKQWLDPRQEARLEDEILALLRIKSKHVVQLYDLIHNDNGTDIILEFIDGRLIEDINISSLSQVAKLKILYQIACGICDIHTQGAVHRDIKPNNIKMDAEGIVKIFDFGLAREIGRNCNTIGFKGTYGYAAPELYREGNIEFRSPIDVYAFGVIAWEMFADRPPELSEIPPQPIASDLKAVSELPDQVADCINQCVAFDPNDRPIMIDIKQLLATYLLQNKHHGNLVFNGNSHSVSHSTRAVRIAIGNCRATIRYDGICFKLQDISGNFSINNEAVEENTELHQSCVITVNVNNSRRFITFDISHPEVTL
ncbi:MAG: serine/threonine protein kinase [Alphaproteobacteria bacterium]|nr:serine/threonine protein kinase [Alphaproteobacteria bacterium]